MKTLKRLGAALGLLAAGVTAPIADPVQTQAKVADNVKQDDKQSVPAAPQTQTKAPQAVRFLDGGTVTEIARGIRGPGFGPPPPAYTFGQRVGGHGSFARVTKVRTHKARRC